LTLSELTHSDLKNVQTSHKPFHCRHCDTALGVRQGDTITTHNLEVTFKRTHKIRCIACGRWNTFSVDKKREKEYLA